MSRIQNPSSRSSNRQRSNRLSYEVQASQKAIYRIRAQSDQQRTQFIIETFSKFFGAGIRENPTAFRGRFRKMAATPFNFYRGSAVLFYQDLKIDQDQFIARNNAAGQIFIHVNNYPIKYFSLVMLFFFREIYMQKTLVHI